MTPSEAIYEAWAAGYSAASGTVLPIWPELPATIQETVQAVGTNFDELQIAVLAFLQGV